MPCVYVLYSNKSNKFYVGSSRKHDPSSRLKSHNSGKTRSTKFGKPWKVVFWESWGSYTDARKKENFLKTGQGRKFIGEKLLQSKAERSHSGLVRRS